MINHLHFLSSGLLRQFICLNKEELDHHLAVQRIGLLTNITLSLFKVLTFRTLTCYASTNVIDSEPEVRRSKCIRRAKDKQAKLYKLFVVYNVNNFKHPDPVLDLRSETVGEYRQLFQIQPSHRGPCYLARLVIRHGDSCVSYRLCLCLSCHWC